MERDNQSSLELVELGTASVDTQGGSGLVIEGGSFWTPIGITND